jgi:hypothetical protein
MQGREIPSCIKALSALRVPKIWFRAYDMKQLETQIPEAIRSTDFDNYIIISDDTEPTQRALDLVRNTLQNYVAASGWSLVSPGSRLTNVSLKPLRGTTPGPFSIDYATVDAVMRQQPVFRAYFAGFSLTGLRKFLWERYPYQPYDWVGRPYRKDVPKEIARYWASDYNECKRLQEGRVELMVHREAYVEHLGSIEYLIVGKEEPKVVYEL